MPTVKWDDHMAEELRENPDQISEYLSVCTEDYDGTFLIALRHVVMAKGGISKAAKETGLSRNAIQKMLVFDGNPKYENLMKLLSYLRLSLKFSVEKNAKNKGVESAEKRTLDGNPLNKRSVSSGIQATAKSATA